MLQTFNRPYIVSSFYIKTTSTSLLLWKSDPKSSSKKVEPPGEQNSMDPSGNLAFPSVNSPIAMVLEAAGDSLNQTVESHLHGIGSSSSSEGLCDKCSNIDFDKLIASYEIDRNHAFGIKEPQGHEHHQSYVALYTSANRSCRLCQFFWKYLETGHLLYNNNIGAFYLLARKHNPNCRDVAGVAEMELYHRANHQYGTPLIRVDIYVHSGIMYVQSE
jgi:hypothetical protein